MGLVDGGAIPVYASATRFVEGRGAALADSAASTTALDDEGAHNRRIKRLIIARGDHFVRAADGVAAHEGALCRVRVWVRERVRVRITVGIGFEIGSGSGSGFEFGSELGLGLRLGLGLDLGLWLWFMFKVS